MCFSATGSFVVSTILVGTGMASIATNRAPTARMLALVPMLFAAQQITEGLVWLTIDRPGVLQSVSVHVFLGFALVVWPAWLPLSLFRMERDRARRRWIAPLLGVGLAVSVIHTAALLRWPPSAEVAGHSIHYDYGLGGGPWVQTAYLLVYIVPTVGPFFVSSVPMARIIGGVLLASLAATRIIQQGTLTSVWCFFAAVVSALIVVALHREHITAEAPLRAAT
jgi:hypothetical protein